MSRSSDPEAPNERSPIQEQRFGNYLLLRHIGSGGMAEVDLARVETVAGVEKNVVVKRIKRSLADNEIYLKMFMDEARIASALSHPNIIQIHDVGKIGKQPFIAMEYVRGKTLAEILIEATRVNKHLPIPFSVGVICSACRALHHAHTMTSFDGEPLHIVHRDVSPDNVFVSYEGDVKLSDFGLAKAKHRSSETQVGIVKGTVGYMAPEQFDNLEIDRRLDVFALGILLWEMVAGRRLFEKATTREAWQEVRDNPVPSPRETRPKCSVALEAIMRRAMNKNPDLRYQTADALLRDLERVAEDEGMWLSPTHRSDVMEALFPGRRKRAMRDATQVARIPTPVALPPRQSELSEAPGGDSATGWRAAVAELEEQVSRNPRWVIVALLITFVMVIGLAGAVRVLWDDAAEAKVAGDKNPKGKVRKGKRGKKN